MKQISIEDIINYLGLQVIRVAGGYDNVYIDNLADVAHVSETTLDWINPTKYNKQELALHSKAKVLLVDESINDIDGKVLIKVKNPKHALAKIGNHFFVEKMPSGIHPTAIINPDARIGENVRIDPYAIIGRATIGDGTVISSYVKLYDNVEIGSECFVKEGAIIGGAGFGFEVDEVGNHFRFPQIGGVKIGNYVEIGANTCIDRGALSDTIIEDYAKIDNLCHIAHNSHIGRNAVVVACAEVSGSCAVGENTWVGPNACIRDQRSVGANSLIGMGAVVAKNVPENEVWAGNPARPLTQ